MLTKVAEFYEADLDDSLAGISSLIKPVIMVVLSVLIGGLVIAMYLPIFKKEEIVG
jgi:type IV pilus assembly protein PilC